MLLQKIEDSKLHHRPQKSAMSSSHSAGSLSTSVTEDHEASSPTVQPIRSKHQRKQEKAARKKNARHQQVGNIIENHSKKSSF